jgi:hypothetical protein
MSDFCCAPARFRGSEEPLGGGDSAGRQLPEAATLCARTGVGRGSKSRTPPPTPASTY